MKNIAIAILILLVNSNRSFAAANQDPADLQARVDACEEALDRGDKVIGEQASAIQLLDEQNVTLQKSLDYLLNETAKARASEASWYRDPKIVAPVAFLAGLTVGLLGFKGR